MTTNILFVCLGNICRSPMAEFIAKDIINKNYKNSNINIKSAGTANYHEGENMHKGTFNLLKRKGIYCDGFLSKPINKQLYDWADIILVMDSNNLNDVKHYFPNTNKVELITNYSTNKSINKVPDPWYTGNFEEVYDILLDCINNFLEQRKISC